MMFVNVQENDFYCLPASVPLHLLFASQMQAADGANRHHCCPKQLSDALNIFLFSIVI
jgi:hypothetical protein